MAKLVLVLAALTFFIACSSDDDIERIPLPAPLELPEAIVGEWEIVLMDGKEPAVYYTEEISQSGVEVTVPQKEFIFDGNGSVFVNLEWVITLTVGDISETYPGTLAMTGTYTATSSTLTTELEDVQLTVDPEDEWVNTDATELGFEIEHAEAELIGDRLTLTEDDGGVIVLERRT